MRIQPFKEDFYLVSILHHEKYLHQTRLLVNDFQDLPNEECRQSGNEFNWILHKKHLQLIHDFEYYPFTEQEVIEADNYLIEFLAQFDETESLL